MSVPPKVTPFAYDENYPAGADPWSGSPTKRVTATRNTGFKPKTKIPAQVVNYELNVAQTSNEAVRSALLCSALNSGRVFKETTFYTTASDTLRATWFPLGGGVSCHIGNATSRVYNVFPNGGSRQNSSLPLIYQASVVNDVIEFATAATKWIVQIGSDGLVFETDVVNSVETAVTTFNANYSGGRLFRRPTDGYFAFVYDSLGSQIRCFSSDPQIVSSFPATAVTTASGFTTTSMQYAADPASGEEWICSGKIGALSGGAWVVADTGISGGYTGLTLCWSQALGAFYCHVEVGTDILLYKRVPGASSWSLVNTTPKTSPSIPFVSPTAFYPSKMLDFGGVLVCVSPLSSNTGGVFASEDGGFSWSCIAPLVKISGSSFRAIQRDDGAIAFYTFDATMTGGTLDVLWMATPVGFSSGQIVGT